MKSIRVFLIDDHAMVREGLKVLLEATRDIRVVGSEESAEAGLQKLQKLQVDVCLLDIRLGGMSGVEACGEFKRLLPEMKIIILTSYLESGMVMQAMEAGADGYLLKEIDKDQLCTSIRQVHAGQTALPEKVTRAMIQSIHSTGEDQMDQRKFDSLTPQEKVVVRLIAEGLMNKEIAGELRLSEKTIKNYVTNIFNKCGLTRRAQLAVWYTKLSSIGEETLSRKRPQDPGSR